MLTKLQSFALTFFGAKIGILMWIDSSWPILDQTVLSSLDLLNMLVKKCIRLSSLANDP